ncbi:MAG TPA: nucleotidyltransferase family protein [Planctomycetota bacterium]|nr:nucleotidyltransferase family protein [Planctomycetota bacterium]
MDALILGAGYATRLYPLTKSRPKPLLPVGGVPIIERICRQLTELNPLETIYIVSNHTFVDQYEAWLTDYGRRHPSPPLIALYDDQTTTPDNRLGAIGDIRFVIEHAALQNDLLVIAGDNLIDGSLTEFVASAKTRGTTVGLKDFRRPEKVSLYGVVELSPDERIVGFEEKPTQPRSTSVAVGLYYFPRKTLPLVQQYLDSGLSKDAPGYYLQWLHRVTPVFGFTLPGDWYDIGDLDSYRQADDRMSQRPVVRA